jgi:hypothetical protein
MADGGDGFSRQRRRRREQDVMECDLEERWEEREAVVGCVFRSNDLHHLLLFNNKQATLQLV